MRSQRAAVLREFLIACTSTTLLFLGLGYIANNKNDQVNAQASAQAESVPNNSSIAHSPVNPSGGVQEESSDPIAVERSVVVERAKAPRPAPPAAPMPASPAVPAPGIQAPVLQPPTFHPPPLIQPAQPPKKPQPSTETPAQSKAEPTKAGKNYRFMYLRHRTAVHDSPDAIVHIPRGFDKSKPAKVILFLHGLTNTLDDVVSIWQVDRHMVNAPANSVLIMPEWALNPRDYSKNAGPFHNKGFFRGMLKEIIANTPELRGTKIDSLKDITLISYSGGFRAARSIIENNGMEHQVKDLVLLDSLYYTDWFDPWLKKNVQNLASGKKRYFNFFFDTADKSVAQYQRLRRMFVAAKQNPSALGKDTKHPHTVMGSQSISNKNVVFKYTKLENSTYIAHQNVVAVYFPRVLEALKLKEQQSLASRSDQEPIL